MVFIACGLNYKTTPLRVREKIALPPAKNDELLIRLSSLPTVNEAILLSTCNRTEFYCDTDDPETLIPWLAWEFQLSPDFLMPYLYTHVEDEGFRHVLRVAAGLDSMMLGEPQIFGQIKQAYQQACQLKTIKANLRHLFPYIFNASKRIRSQSGIGVNPISIAYAAVQLIKQSFPAYQSLEVLLIGSGETATLVAKYLYKQGVRRFYVASRTQENAENLANSLHAQAISIPEIPQTLEKVDVVISATTCPLPFITKNIVAHALNQRRTPSLFFLDLAVPRDIEPNVGDLKHVQLYNIDDLQQYITSGLDKRRSAALHAEDLISYELENFNRWRRSLQAKNAICQYRHSMHQLAHRELERAHAKLSAGFNHDIVLNEFCERLVNKLTHAPTVSLKKAAWDSHDKLHDLTNYLFLNLKPYEKIP